MAIMASELESKGFKQVMDVVEFDLVYSSDEILSKQSPRVRAMLELAQKNPNLRILLRDPKGLVYAIGRSCFNQGYPRNQNSKDGP